MAKLNFEMLNKAKKKQLLRELADYGIEKLPYLIVKWGKRLRMFSGNLDRETIYKLLKEVNVDSIGLYFASTEGGIRLGIDALHLLSGQVTHGIVEIDDKQAEQWFKGRDIELNHEQEKEIKGLRKFIILSNKGDLIGMSKRGFQGISNCMPKERRIKEK